MRLVNRTPFAATLLPVEMPGEGAVCAVVIVKATYALRADGTLAPAADAVPITSGRLSTPFGVFHGDMFPEKEGADFVVLGTVRATRPITQVVVEAQIGRHASRLRVTGDRRWRRRGLLDDVLVPSEPRPFTEMPLSYARAFGARLDPAAATPPWPDNPDGVGCYRTADAADGQPLPNVEPGDGPFITAWDDRPPVAGWGPYPSHWGLRQREALKVDAEAMAFRSVSWRLFNNAHPALVVAAIIPGTPVRIAHVTEVPIEFALPHDGAEVTVEVGRQEQRIAARVDGVFVWTDARKVVVTQRATFTYPVRSGERRTATVALAAR